MTPTLKPFCPDSLPKHKLTMVSAISHMVKTPTKHTPLGYVAEIKSKRSSVQIKKKQLSVVVISLYGTQIVVLICVWDFVLIFLESRALLATNLAKTKFSLSIQVLIRALHMRIIHITKFLFVVKPNFVTANHI
jgi:hypothetical protein